MSTLEDLEAAVRKLAAENPDMLYLNDGDGCKYTPDHNNPMGCIIGAAIRILETTFDFTDCDERNLLAKRVLPIVWPVLKEEDVHWFDKVQFYQDNNHTWADSVKMADDDKQKRP